MLKHIKLKKTLLRYIINPIVFFYLESKSFELYSLLSVVNYTTNYINNVRSFKLNVFLIILNIL